MIGGRMTTTRFAIAAVATALMSTSALAADLGGNCCADLEERIAELEATTVRKGNRKVSLTISGFVGHAVMWWNDGTQSDIYFGDTGNLTSRFRLVGTAKINPSLTAGFLYEFQAVSSSMGSSNQLNGGDDLGTTGAPQNAGLGYGGCGQNLNSLNSPGCIALRDQTVWLRHAQLGMVKIGHGSTATDNLVLIDLGGMGVAGTPDQALNIGGMILRGKSGTLGSATTLNWQSAIRGHESWDTFRRNHVLYETPTLMGFSLQAAIAEDNFWDVALRYAGEFNGIRIAGGIGYQEDTKFNSGFQNLNQAGALCSDTLTNTGVAQAGIAAGAAPTVPGSGKCDVKSKEIKGAASVLHVPTGLFLTGSAGQRELSGTGTRASASGTAGFSAGNYNGPDATYWHLAAGVSKNFFGIGNTVGFLEYGEHRGFLAQSQFLNVVGSATSGPTYRTDAGSNVTNWGLGVVQYVDAAAMEVFATYKNYSFDGNGFLNAGNSSLNKVNGGVNDLQMFMVGTRINF